MGRSGCVIAVLATILLFAQGAMGQTDILCSSVTWITGYDAIECTVPAAVTRGITFALTYTYTQPYTTSPPQYQPRVVHDNGRGVCTNGTSTAGPFAYGEVNLVGSGLSWASYQQVRKAKIEDYGYVPPDPLPMWISTHWTQPVSFQARGCCS